MADLTRVGQNNYKREIMVGVSDSMSTGDNTVFNLPANSLVTGVSVVVTSADTTALSTVDVKVGITVVANEVAVAAAGVASGTVTPTYFADGGAVSVAAGATVPAGDGVIRLVVEYIELDTVTGDLTAI
jgi:hypothetical protein